MGPDELEQITRGIKALCPAQKWDEYTPDLWLGVLQRVRYADATVALERLAARQPWIGPSDIVREVSAIRGGRLERVLVEPNDVPGVSSCDEERALRKAIADGTMDQAQALRYTAWGGSLHLESQRQAVGARTVRGELA